MAGGGLQHVETAFILVLSTMNCRDPVPTLMSQATAKTAIFCSSVLCFCKTISPIYLLGDRQNDQIPTVAHIGHAIFFLT